MYHLRVLKTICLTLAFLCLSLTTSAVTFEIGEIDADLKTTGQGGLNSGSYSQMVIDDNGKIHVVYKQIDSSNAFQTIYASSDDHGITWEIFYPMLIASQTYQPTSHSSLQVIPDANNIYQPRIGFYDNLTKNLTHLFSDDIENGASWTFSTVDLTANQSNGNGQYVKFLGSGDEACENDLVYYDAVNGNLKYATYNTASSSWTTTTIDNSANDVGIQISTASDCTLGYFYVAYYDSTASAQNLKFVYSLNGGATWSTPENAVTTGNVGIFNSIGVSSSGEVYIAYRDSTSSLLRLAKKSSATASSSSWTSFTIASVNPTAISLRVDSSDTLHVAYQASNALYYTSSTNAGSTWSAPVTVDNTSSTNVGSYPSLSFMPPDDRVFISYNDSGNQDFLIAYVPEEICDGLDNNGDGQIDEGLTFTTYYQDSDGDTYGNSSVSQTVCAQPTGYVANSSDCNDTRASISPIATEICDSIDNDCDGSTDENGTYYFYQDSDGDSYGNASAQIQACSAPSGYVINSLDCNDTNSNISPTRSESCDNLDNDCDGRVDEGLQFTTYYRDSDRDGYGDPSNSQYICSSRPSGYVTNSNDCNDSQILAYTGATEVCDSVDNDCDGSTDEGLLTTYYADNDNDGYGSTPALACSQQVGYSRFSGDCNDSNDRILPGATEICDSIDNDCDGSTDESGASGSLTYYADSDGDGYGNASVSQSACSKPSGYVTNSTDCNDSTTSANPLATETCDSLDNDCDGSIDEAGATGTTTYYADTDGDGYGNATSTTQACSRPTGYASNNTDCNDTSNTTYPSATEICDTRDNDCDSSIDEGVTTTFYQDSDRDGYGNATSTTQACSAPSGYVATATDCNDNRASIKPNATEICDGVDNDCDSGIDENLLITVYDDLDRDGHGNPNTLDQQCTATVGQSTLGDDCNDTDASVYTGATEVCGDALDNDCNGTADDATTGLVTHYADIDSDGFGDANGVGTQSCLVPQGRIDNNEDCDDTSDAVNPLASEVCNDGINNDCSASTADNTGVIYFQDADGDGLGNSAFTQASCGETPSGYVTNDTDCDDTNATITGPQNYYTDFDGDGYGIVDDGLIKNTCQTLPANYALNADDCNDASSSANPGETLEVCGDGVDNNCDGTTDNLIACTDADSDGVMADVDCNDNDSSLGELNNYYPDSDGDGFGDTEGLVKESCSTPDGHVANAIDCDDTNAEINASVAEVCDDAFDNNCDGAINEGCTTGGGEGSGGGDASGGSSGDTGSGGTGGDSSGDTTTGDTGTDSSEDTSGTGETSGNDDSDPKTQETVDSGDAASGSSGGCNLAGVHDSQPNSTALSLLMVLMMGYVFKRRTLNQRGDRQVHSLT